MSLKVVGAFTGLLTIQKINFALLKREKNSWVQMYSGRPQRTTILLV